MGWCWLLTGKCLMWGLLFCDVTDHQYTRLVLDPRGHSMAAWNAITHDDEFRALSETVVGCCCVSYGRQRVAWLGLWQA